MVPGANVPVVSSTIVATNSWPRMMGDIPCGMMTGPSKYSSRSVPQIPVRSTRTSAIPGVNSGVGISSTRISFALYQSAARIHTPEYSSFEAMV
ncbi:unannotated protein [freshwater metagenome]|uniref:Unannotated protein n=1 Tax=freshwater metagenome TaxID=449393 RepID=A0A6J6ZEU2_9ZZZZ